MLSHAKLPTADFESLRHVNITGISRFIIAVLCVLFFVASLIPSQAYGDDEVETTDNVVRVGWYETPFNTTDQFGRKSGYAYEYQRKIAAYTGWEYEYVEGSWSELLQKLVNGEIDLMSDVSYTNERAEKMLYPALSMGTEAYYIFISANNTEISADDYADLAGKRIGVTEDSIQQRFLIEWAEKHGMDFEIVPVTTSEEESIQMVLDGKLDAFATLDAYGNSNDIEPVCKIGSSDFYFAVNKDRPDLLKELDEALNHIQDANLYYNQQLNAKYIMGTSASQYLTSNEKAWLAEHGPIRVGYQDNYLAFCAQDPKTGELTGALKDYLAYASTCFENGTIEFEPICYPTAADAMEALINGEIDCMFPSNITDYDGEELGIALSPSLMRTEMDAVVREADQKEFIRKEHVIVAVNEGNPNYEKWLMDHYPAWEIKYYPDTPTALEGIAKGEADCIVISNYRYSNIAKQCEELHLTTVYTGVDMDYSLAERDGDTELYSIITKTIQQVPESTMHTALTYYSTEDVKLTFADVIKDNIVPILLVLIAILILILVLVLRNVKTQKKVQDEEKVIDELSEKAFVDSLTSVRNDRAYSDYIHKFQDEHNESDSTCEFAIGIFDCDNLKGINDIYGHDKGDIYIKTASRLICRIFAHSPVFRIGGDEFAVVLEDSDFDNRDKLVEEFEAAKVKSCKEKDNPWEQIHVAVGIAVYDPVHDADISDTSRRADKIMYENKRLSKKKRYQESSS